LKKLFFTSLLIAIFYIAEAQLDSIHFVPPMHARVDWGPQYLLLTTSETTPFPVDIKDGSGNIIQTVNISITSPYKYLIGDTDDTFTFVTENELHTALQRKGLIIEGKKKFYAYVRIHSENKNQASDLTCKGSAALGKIFRIGHLLQNTGTSLSNFVGILATEDSTILKLSDFDPNTKFRKNNTDIISSGIETFSLNKGESLVIAQYLNSNSTNQPPNGMMGALLESSKPIAVNTGSWCGSPVNTGDKDTGIDQIAPLEKMGKEYILNKGNGNTTLERPIIVAHYNNTMVYLNGATNPSIILNAGEYYAVPTSFYTAQNNLHIKSSEAIFVYQMIGGISSGTNAYRTEGLIFVPPISCNIPSSIDNIFEPNVVGSIVFNGGVMITAMKDSLVEVFVDGQLANIGTPNAVTGNPDFVTYRSLNLFSASKVTNFISVKAHGAVQLATFGQNSAASFAAFYSGFSKTNATTNIAVKNIGDGVCPDTLIVTGHFDGVQWMYADSLIKYGHDTMLIVNGPGQYHVLGYLGVCRQNETSKDSIIVDFISPEFDYTIKNPSCYGYSDGSILIHQPYGGYPPYQYSINKGFDFIKDSLFIGLNADIFKLVVRDSVGCYNYPLTVMLDQPEPFSVEIVKKSHINIDVLKLGQTIKLEGIANRPYVFTKWSPTNDSTCNFCPINRVKVLKTANYVTLLVKDSLGCPAFDTIVLYVEPPVYIPNIFDPANGVLKNSNFTIFSESQLPIHKLVIFDRWGNQVFSTTNIHTNVIEEGWDGKINGKLVDPAVFVYYAEVEILPNIIVLFKGEITVAY